MALPSTLEWSVRPDGATATNGGGRDLAIGGQDADVNRATPVLALTDGVVHAADPTVLHSALGGFAASMVGLVVYVAGTGIAATTNNRWVIVGFTDAHTVTLHESPLAASADATGLVVNVGGALRMGSADDNAFVNLTVPGNTLRIRPGSYVLTANVGPASATSAFLCTSLVCDEGVTVSCGAYIVRLGPNWWIQGGNWTGTAAYVIECTGGVSHVRNATVRNTSTTANRMALGTSHFSGYSNAFECDLRSDAGRATDAQVTNCRLHDSPVGVYSQVASAEHSVFVNCGTGLETLANTPGNGRSKAEHCTFHNCAIGVKLYPGHAKGTVRHNLFHACGTAIAMGATGSPSPHLAMGHNGFWGSTVADHGAGIPAGEGDLTAANPDLRDPAAGDLTPRNPAFRYAAPPAPGLAAACLSYGCPGAVQPRPQLPALRQIGGLLQ